MPPVTLLIPPLLHRLRTAIVAVLLVVMPLQGALQWVVGLQGQGQRHVHASQTGREVSPSALRLLLDRLHAAQPQPLKSLGLAQLKPRAEAQPHAHGSLVHTHGADTHDVVPVADADDDGTRGATAFLAWLPSPLRMGRPLPQIAPVDTALLSAGRDVPPDRIPPRA